MTQFIKELVSALIVTLILVFIAQQSGMFIARTTAYNAIVK